MSKKADEGTSNENPSRIDISVGTSTVGWGNDGLPVIKQVSSHVRVIGVKINRAG